MKKKVLILLAVLASGATAWAYGPYCGPVPRFGAPIYVNCAPVVRVGCYPAPAVVYAAPVVYPAPVVYQTPVVCNAPTPVVYAQPAYYAPPMVQVVATLPLWPFWCGGHHGGHRW